VLRRKVRGRVPLTSGDRLLFVQLYRWFPLLFATLVPTFERCLKRRAIKWSAENAPGPRAMITRKHVAHTPLVGQA